MSYHLDAGALRTKIQVFAAQETECYNENGYPIRERQNVFGAGKYRRCRWINFHGTEVFEAKKLGVEEGATLTLRYSSNITPACLVYRGNAQTPYEVISVNDIEDRHVWLEVKVTRKVVAV